jgi:hypothetical protein
MTLSAEEFIKRFLRHVLPCGFYKIRYFGLFAQCNAKTKLQTCLNLLDTEIFLPEYEGLNAVEVFREITGRDPFQCPVCGKGRMIPVACCPESLQNTG